MRNKFNVGDFVIYKNGDTYYLGEIKEVLKFRRAYRVWYHTGDTTAITPENMLIPIYNAYAFDIKRKRA